MVLNNATLGDKLGIDYAQKGGFKVWSKDRIVFAILRGIWNKDTSLRYANAIKQCAQPLTVEPWGHIAYLDDWILGSPEIEPVIKALGGWGVENDLRRLAIVYTPNTLKSYQLKKMVLESQGEFVLHYYADVESAFAWLEAEGFSTADKHFTPPLQGVFN